MKKKKNIYIYIYIYIYTHMFCILWDILNLFFISKVIFEGRVKLWCTTPCPFICLVYD